MTAYQLWLQITLAGKDVEWEDKKSYMMVLFHCTVLCYTALHCSTIQQSYNCVGPAFGKVRLSADALIDKIQKGSVFVVPSSVVEGSQLCPQAVVRSPPSVRGEREHRRQDQHHWVRKSKTRE